MTVPSLGLVYVCASSFDTPAGKLLLAMAGYDEKGVGKVPDITPHLHRQCENSERNARIMKRDSTITLYPRDGSAPFATLVRFCIGDCLRGVVLRDVPSLGVGQRFSIKHIEGLETSIIQHVMPVTPELFTSLYPEGSEKALRQVNLKVRQASYTIMSFLLYRQRQLSMASRTLQRRSA